MLYCQNGFIDLILVLKQFRKPVINKIVYSYLKLKTDFRELLAKTELVFLILVSHSSRILAKCIHDRCEFGGWDARSQSWQNNFKSVHFRRIGITEMIGIYSNHLRAVR